MELNQVIELFEPKKLIAKAEEAMWLRSGGVQGRDRHRANVLARALVTAVLRKRGWSFPQIGTLLNRDHSTIINLYKNIDIYSRYYPNFRKSLDALMEDFT